MRDDHHHAARVRIQSTASTSAARCQKVVAASAAAESAPNACTGDAVAAGATMINDIWALRQPGALEAAAALGVPVCLMHMQGTPETMQLNPVYSDVVGEVREFLAERIDAAVEVGIERDRIMVDPGFGFGKTIAHNLTLLNALGDLRDLGVPLLVGLSRKSMIGKILEDPAAPRLYGSIALAVVAALHGAEVIRVHDVAETADAVAMLRALRQVQS